MDNTTITNLLTIVLAVFIAILVILVTVYVILLSKNRKSKKEETKKETKTVSKKNKKAETSSSISSVESIHKFMEFEKVEDNMIIQKEKFKYIMVVECQGVNYDLMSGVEKTGVEEGFLQFLNTLRHPVQLYIQTRTINLENSINKYKQRVSDIESELLRRRQEYYNMKDDRSYTREEKQRAFYAMTKQTNLYEYGKDIINDTEKMSLNRNILSKKYYVVIPYYPSDLGENEFDAEEIRSIAFSELYTRSQAIIRTLSACGVNGKILNSKELIELLYVAYNRDHEEVFNLDRALQAQYDKLYSTSEDVYRKMIRELDKKIEEEAIEKAKEKLEVAKTESEKAVKKKREEFDDLVSQLAKIILEDNRQYVDNELIDGAIQEIEKETKGENSNQKEGKKDEKESKPTRRTIKKQQ